MSAEIINLRKARKQRERDRKTAEAEQNRARFGRTKAEREVETLVRARAEQALDGHLRADNAPPSASDGHAASQDDAPKKPPRAPQ